MRWLTVVALALGLMSLPSTASALSAPGELAAEHRNASTPILSWAPTSVGVRYQVQIDQDETFGSPIYDVWTTNDRVVPRQALPVGTLSWRVRTLGASTNSPWSATQSLSVSPAGIPVPTHPSTGDTLHTPQEPPVLRWQTSRGATSYTVQVDGDSDFIGAASRTTRSTSLVWPDPLGPGDWFWRVIASKGDGIVSKPSNASWFNVVGLQQPQLTFPEDSFQQPVEDVVLDWEPVPGAKAYDLQVALDASFQNFALNVSGIQATRYSPPVTLNNDEFWWRVRAVDPANQRTDWTESKSDFKRQWPDRPQPVWPLGTQATPGTQEVESTYFQWSPVQHASHYQVEVARDVNFTVDVRSCVTASTTFVPRYTGRSNDCLAGATSPGTAPDVWYWRVRPIDRPYNQEGLRGVFSAPQAFYRVPRPLATTPPTDGEIATRYGTGLRVAMTGTGARNPQFGCESTPSRGFPESSDESAYVAPSICDNLPTTPVFSWTRQPDIDHYVVWFAQDENFTTTKYQPVVTWNTMLALDDRRASGDPWALPDSESGHPYYWYVQPCRADGWCGPRPDSQATGVSGAAAFQKVSPAVEPLESSRADGTDISFTWRDYRDTNAAADGKGEASQQSAQTYRVQVDTEPSFSSPIDTATIDQTTFTAPFKLYPEGRLFWRVQARDGNDNPLPWSVPQELVKRTPPIGRTSPADGVTVAGTVPLEWQAQAFATSYVLEVYKDNDSAFSSANRVISVTTPTAAYASSSPMPHSALPYLWRVRRIDASGNPGPWSATGSFLSKGAVPELLAPSDGAWQPRTGGFFEWSDVPDAASYEFAARSDSGDSLVRTTVATAYAPSELSNGSWSWTVTALDSAGNALGKSPVRRFRVDAAGPTVTRYSPASTARARANVTGSFSEPVARATVNGKTFLLKKVGTRRKVLARVTTSSDGLRAVLNPSQRLRRGAYYTATLTSRITDRQGNPLTAKSWRFRVR